MKNINLNTLIAFLIGIAIAYLYTEFYVNSSEVENNGNATINHDHNTNENYSANVKIAQKFMQLHEVEDLESQISMLSDDLIHEPPRYGSELQDKDGFINDVKGYQDNFENMNFTPTYWLPGSDSLGNLNGSVRVYGVWTATHTPTQKGITLRSYHYWDFDENGLIIQVGDYFDATGMMMSLTSDE